MAKQSGKRRREGTGAKPASSCNKKVVGPELEMPMGQVKYTMGKSP